MCLARAYDAGGLNWRGALEDKQGLPWDRVGSFLTRLSNFIPLDKFSVQLPSEMAKFMAAVMNVVDEDDEAIFFSPIGKKTPPEESTDKSELSAENVVKQQKADTDAKSKAAKAKYTSARIAAEAPVKRSDTKTTKREIFDESLSESFLRAHTGQQVCC